MDAISGLVPSGLEPAAAIILVTASFFTSALTAAFGVGGGVFMLALMGPRTGITKAVDWPLRFSLAGEPSVSPYRRSPKAPRVAEDRL